MPRTYRVMFRASRGRSRRSSSCAFSLPIFAPSDFTWSVRTVVGCAGIRAHMFYTRRSGETPICPYSPWGDSLRSSRPRIEKYLNSSSSTSAPCRCLVGIPAGKPTSCAATFPRRSCMDWLIVFVWPPRIGRALRVRYSRVATTTRPPGNALVVLHVSRHGRDGCHGDTGERAGPSADGYRGRCDQHSPGPPTNLCGRGSGTNPIGSVKKRKRRPVKGPPLTG